MGRSGCTDDCEDQWQFIRWRGAVNSAIRGKRGQAFLCELLAALDAMPEKRLVANSFGKAECGYCTLGVIGAERGVTMPELGDDDYQEDVSREAADALNIPSSLAAEIMYANDEGGWNDSPEDRWVRMRKWVAKQIRSEQPQP